jgi:hypothetical protein
VPPIGSVTSSRHTGVHHMPEAFTNFTLSKRSDCSFCDNRQAAYIIAGPKVFICSNCVEKCREVGSSLIATNALFSQAAASLGDNKTASSSLDGPDGLTAI